MVRFGAVLSVISIGACSARRARPVDAPLLHDAGPDEGVGAASCPNGWCQILAGTFLFGSPESEWGRGLYSEDQALVTLTRSFLIGQFEVTQREWTAMDLPNPSGKMPDGTGDCLGPECPVGNVTWFEAATYANLLSRANGWAECYQLSGCANSVGSGLTCTDVSAMTTSIYDCEGFRLPTEAEWEYAARAGTTTAFYAGEITPQAARGQCFPDRVLDPISWYCDNAMGTTHPVGMRVSNRWSLHDMLGNVAEWTNDLATGVALPNPSTDPGAMLRSGGSTIFRGGLFNAWSLLLRSASRALSGSRDARGPGLGFRLVRTIPSSQQRR